MLQLKHIITVRFCTRVLILCFLFATVFRLFFPIVTVFRFRRRRNQDSHRFLTGFLPFRRDSQRRLLLRRDSPPSLRRHSPLLAFSIFILLILTVSSDSSDSHWFFRFFRFSLILTDFITEIHRRHRWFFRFFRLSNLIHHRNPSPAPLFSLFSLFWSNHQFNSFNHCNDSMMF
jgi:hypothetical protein